MKHELRKGAFIIKPRSTYHILKTIYENSLADTNMILLQNKAEDYDDDNFCFVENLRSRSLNNANITFTIKDYGNGRLYNSLYCKSKKRLNPYSLKAKCKGDKTL